MRSQIEREAVCAWAVAASFATTGRCSETGSGGTADCAAAVDVLCVVAGSPVALGPAVGGCWSDEVDPAAAAAAAPWSDLLVSAAGGAAFGAFALRRACRETALFAVEAEEDELDVEGAASAGGLVLTGGAGATPLSSGTGTGAASLGTALAFDDEVAADGFGAAVEVAWPVAPGVTGGGAF